MCFFFLGGGGGGWDRVSKHIHYNMRCGTERI